MRQALGWAVVLVGCAGSPARGQYEPWVSRGLPGDVAREHVQEIKAAPFTYTVRHGGTVDGRMCTSRPGVWDAFEQTWESNRSLRLENIGPRPVINPWLRIGPVDTFSQQTIADAVTRGLTSDRDKALALFYFYIAHRYHKGNGDNGAQGDTSQAVNVFGFNTCGNSTLVLADLLARAGVKKAIFSHCPGHVVPQVFFDGRYNTLDGDMATFMLLRDNRTLANEQDLVRDHDLAKRVHQYGILNRWDPAGNEDYAQYYTWEGTSTVPLKGWNWWTMGMVLRPRESIEWRWGHGRPVKYHGDMTGHPPIAPDTISNGLWEYAPDFKDDARWRAGATATNITNTGGVLAAKDGGTGTVVWAMKVPYQFVGGEVTAEGEGCSWEIGFVSPKDWKPAFVPLRPADFDGLFRGHTNMANEYWLRCTLAGKATLRGLRIRNDLQMAPLAMPALTVGDNRVEYVEHTDERSGTNSGRRLRVTHRWVERSAWRPPAAPAAARAPADGGDSDGTDVAFRWQPAASPDGTAVTDYHFQLSDRPDLRWPLSPNFDRYVSRTPDAGQARFTLPRPGLLAPGTTYYWRVRAQDARGVWGPWGPTWRFTARGPAYPVDVALKHDPAAGVGTLTWAANPVGRPPVQYRVYGSDEKGFTVSDRPYPVRLGDTKELTSPFPANFVAEVTGTSLAVVGVGNPLPNANRAYYRVVAVDASGKRSGDSDYVEAPRPTIFSPPVTRAAAGQPYRYQVRAIRSLGDLTRRDSARPRPGTRFWKIEPLKFRLAEAPPWMKIDPDTGLITGTCDGTGGPVTVSVTLTKEHRLVHDENNIMWGNEHESKRTFETLGPVTQRFVIEVGKGD